LPRRFSDAFAVQPPVVLTVSRTLLRRPSRSALRETVLGASSDSAQAGTSARRGSTTALGASRTVQPTVRTVVSALPTASVERTSSVCDAAPRAGVWTGDAHGAHAPPVDAALRRRPRVVVGDRGRDLRRRVVRDGLGGPCDGRRRRARVDGEAAAR
jgi:hypothetical protein